MVWRRALELFRADWAAEICESVAWLLDMLELRLTESRGLPLPALKGNMLKSVGRVDSSVGWSGKSPPVAGSSSLMFLRQTGHVACYVT